MSVIHTMVGKHLCKEISICVSLESQTSTTRESFKADLPSTAKETSKPHYMKMGSHTHKQTAEDGNTIDSDNYSVRESSYSDDDGRLEGHTRQDNEDKAEETDR